MFRSLNLTLRLTWSISLALIQPLIKKAVVKINRYVPLNSNRFVIGGEQVVSCESKYTFRDEQKAPW